MLFRSTKQYGRSIRTPLIAAAARDVARNDIERSCGGPGRGGCKGGGVRATAAPFSPCELPSGMAVRFSRQFPTPLEQHHFIYHTGRTAFARHAIGTRLI